MSLKLSILKVLRTVINPIGYDVVKYKTSNPSHIILNHLKVNKINAILDVGANTGQYSMGMFNAGYKSRILSFEPLSDAYQELKQNASGNPNWQVYNIALGDVGRTDTINISKHSPSSSILPMSDVHKKAAPGSEYLKEEQIEIKTLDSIFDTLGISGSNVFLKVDTQGYEKKVLDGVVDSFRKISGIQLELSASQLYEGEETYYSICSFLEDRDFHLVQILPGFVHPDTREMLQFDAIFFRKY